MPKIDNLHAVAARSRRVEWMNSLVMGAALLSASAVYAQSQPLTLEQSAIVYDQCLARAAVRASRTDAADEAIYGLARDACAGTRIMLTAGSEIDSDLRSVLDAIDAEKEANFPRLTRQIREQRRQREAQY